jgi:predicted alpha/beta superfamily hydrolase
MLTRHEDFASRFSAARRVEVWQPDAIPAGERLPVIYMHDGQNLFDPATAYGGVDWGVQEAVIRLMQAGRLRGVIIVGVWNTSERWREYMPAVKLKGSSAKVILKNFLAKAGGKPLSDQYLRFLVEELKPFIDTRYPTLPDRDNTFIMGSSMGGLISLYALCRYPGVFRGAGCLSTHWPAGESPLVEALGALIPPAGEHRLYFDYGTATLDANYEPYQIQMDTLLRAKGYTADEDWMTRKFEGAEHNEAAWRERVHIPLEFLLGTAGKGL